MHSEKTENTTELQINMQCLLATQITITYVFTCKVFFCVFSTKPMMKQRSRVLLRKLKEPVISTESMNQELIDCTMQNWLQDIGKGRHSTLTCFVTNEK